MLQQVEKLSFEFSFKLLVQLTEELITIKIVIKITRQNN